MSDMELANRVITSGTLDQVLGFEILEAGAERARARFPVEDRVCQPFGLVHGGAYAALAETLVSAATYVSVSGDGSVAMGQSNNTTFMRPVTSGNIHADATVRHRGRTTWVWDVDFTDDDGKLCASSRVTMAVRAPR